MIDVYIAFFIVLWVLFGTLAFWLSFSCYNPYDNVPIGLKLLNGIVAFFWNILYVIWYIVLYLFGYQCPSSAIEEVFDSVM